MDMGHVDILLETVRAAVIAAVFVYFTALGKNSELRRHGGWRLILSGFGLILFGAVLDITDNFPRLNVFIVVGRTATEAFLEKIVGYTFGFLCLALGFWKWIPHVLMMERTRQELKRSHDELEEAMANVKVLRGLLPICASCKKVRDDKGYWNQIESYLKKHSEVEFTHGICPECMIKMQAELDSHRS